MRREGRVFYSNDADYTSKYCQKQAFFEQFYNWVKNCGGMVMNKKEPMRGISLDCSPVLADFILLLKSASIRVQSYLCLFCLEGLFRL
jgi:hypothetical protein